VAAVGLTVFAATQRQSLPTLSGTTLTGQSLTASSYAGGAPLVVNVWASWCAPCRQEIPLLARAARRGVRVIGIDERDLATNARTFARAHGATYPSLADPQGRLLAGLRMLPQEGIPSSLVVAADGRIVARVIGPLTPQSLRRALAEAKS
jgi:cytochrome c biogenesis protein CcmG/thiol:disulfide interchange protein DsbE